MLEMNISVTTPVEAVNCSYGCDTGLLYTYKKKWIFDEQHSKQNMDESLAGTNIYVLYYQNVYSTAGMSLGATKLEGNPASTC